MTTSRRPFWLAKMRVVRSSCDTKHTKSLPHHDRLMHMTYCTPYLRCTPTHGWPPTPAPHALTSFMASMSAPAARRALTTSTWSFQLAQARAVRPSFDTQRTRSPPHHDHLMHMTHCCSTPCLRCVSTHQHNDLLQLTLPLASMLAPAARIASTISRWPLPLDKMRDVKPHCDTQRTRSPPPHHDCLISCT